MPRPDNNDEMIKKIDRLSLNANDWKKGWLFFFPNELDMRE